MDKPSVNLGSMELTHYGNKGVGGRYIIQGAELPIYGYVARRAGKIKERVINETHDTVMKELTLRPVVLREGA